MRELTQLRREYLLCRRSGGFGHQWDSFAPLRRDSEWGARVLSLRCARCTTERYDRIDSTTAVVNRRYKYPPGYKIAAEAGVTAIDVRREVMRRLAKQKARGRARKIAA